MPASVQAERDFSILEGPLFHPDGGNHTIQQRRQVMADKKKKPRMIDPEPWADRAEWMEGEKAIRERQRLYGSVRIRMIPKRNEPKTEETGQNRGNPDKE